MGIDSNESIYQELKVSSYIPFKDLFTPNDSVTITETLMGWTF